MNIEKLQDYINDLDRKPFPPSVSVPSDFLRKMMHIVRAWDFYLSAKDCGDERYANELAEETRTSLKEFQEIYCEWDLND